MTATQKVFLQTPLFTVFPRKKELDADPYENAVSQPAELANMKFPN